MQSKWNEKEGNSQGRICQGDRNGEMVEGINNENKLGLQNWNHKVCKSDNK